MPSIIVRYPDGRTSAVKSKPFVYEELLERSIADIPELLPLEVISDEAAYYQTLGRQWPAGTGIADVILVGSDGVLTIVETKLKRNPEHRREVIAQLLEYAAYLSEWTIHDIARRTEAYYSSEDIPAARRGLSFDDLLKEFLEDSEGTVEAFRATIEQNLKSGRLRLIVAVDEVGEQAQKIVTFLNANSNFDIFLLQITAYDEGDRNIFVPALYGYARKTARNVTPTKSWSWDVYESEYGWTSDQIIAAKRLLERLESVTGQWQGETKLQAGWMTVRRLGRDLFGAQVSKRNGVEMWFTLSEPNFEFPQTVHVRRTRTTVYLSGDTERLSDADLLSLCSQALKGVGIEPR
jgi:hypothetical protein